TVDIQLPGENGLDLTKKLKAECPNLKVIILTMHDTPEYREAAYQSQANYFVSKGSSTKEEILTLIESALSET
ncbi:MAG TPA: response regulator transcription factor, partial [Thermodesulfobacteriota bacterium]|nr:response regulator transcription factor [Thermodesulfobacteriota bacterium]